MQGRAVTPATHSEAVHQKIKYTYLCMCVFGVSEGEKERERKEAEEKERSGKRKEEMRGGKMLTIGQQQ